MIGCCKKLARVRHPGGMRPLYKQLFPPKNTIVNLVLEWPTQLPPSLSSHPEHQHIKQNMVAKDDPVVDIVEEEEEWPEAGVQNPEEAERYTEKINNVFDHLSTLIHQDTKTALAQTMQNFKKIVARQWESMGDADVDVVLRSKRSDGNVFTTAFDGRGHRGGGPPRRVTIR